MPILDLYDDPRGVVLTRHLARTAGTLTDKLAAFAPSASDKLAAIPDRLFALVGEADGVPVRKYAMHNPEHLATSILYFLDCGAALPDPVRQKVAMNLITACGWYETAPPPALTKVAMLGAIVNTGLTLTSAPGQLRAAKAKNMEGDAAFRAAQMTGVKQAGKAVHIQDGNADEAWRALERFIRGDESLEDMRNRYDNDYPNLFSDPGNVVKEAAEVQFQGGLSSDPRPQTPAKRFAIAPKVSFDVGSFETLGVDSGDDMARHYALPHFSLYPIDTAEEVKTASAYFMEHAREFSMDDRRIFATSVAARAEDLGVKVASTLEKIASSSYGPHVVSELHGRIRALEGTDKAAAYEVLLENLEDVPPLVAYDMLKLADEDTGVDMGYGRAVTGFRDPLSAIFGAPENPIYSWAGKGSYVTEEILRAYAKLCPDLDKVIEKDWSVKFVDDPIKEFDKLPEAKKIIIARLANGEAFRFI